MTSRDTREAHPGHSDLGPSSKDWLPGSAGRDEDFTPEKDLWTLNHKGDVGAGRPAEDSGSDIGLEDIPKGGRDDIQPEDTHESAHAPGSDVQPGTGTEGRNWQSREPDPHDEEDKLNQALKDSFPASDPPQPAQPGVTGWDLKDEKDAGKPRTED